MYISFCLCQELGYSTHNRQKYCNILWWLVECAWSHDAAPTDCAESDYTEDCPLYYHPGVTWEVLCHLLQRLIVRRPVGMLSHPSGKLCSHMYIWHHPRTPCTRWSRWRNTICHLCDCWCNSRSDQDRQCQNVPRRQTGDNYSTA